MFICGYHFPADEGIDVEFEKVVEKVKQSVGDTSKKVVSLTGETAKGDVVINLEVPVGTFAHMAFVDFYKTAEDEAENKMIYFTNKYQISEISKAVDGDVTKDLCKNLDDMHLYRVKVV